MEVNTYEHLLDVSELEPPEPLVQTIDKTLSLPEGNYLCMLHRQEPCLLFGKLDELGYDYIQQTGTHNTEIEVYIWKQGDKLARQRVMQSIGDTP
ncbi:MAG: DUF2249 domain-containing protein [Gammaproteobacteria bacterium]|nr:DUF2249 domain-containing protein [Gammaproteobacteria bacterium]